MIFTIINENLINKEYIENHTEGFKQLEKEIKKFNPALMEKLCGIPKEIIREVARIYAKAKTSIIFWEWVFLNISMELKTLFINKFSIDHRTSWETGTGLHPLRGQNNVQGASDAGNTYVISRL